MLSTKVGVRVRTYTYIQNCFALVRPILVLPGSWISMIQNKFIKMQKTNKEIGLPVKARETVRSLSCRIKKASIWRIRLYFCRPGFLKFSLCFLKCVLHLLYFSKFCSFLLSSKLFLNAPLKSSISINNQCWWCKRFLKIQHKNYWMN